MRAFDKASRADQTLLINGLFDRKGKGEYSLNLKNREVLHIISRTETDSASMGLGG